MIGCAQIATIIIMLPDYSVTGHSHYEGKIMLVIMNPSCMFASVITVE